ELECTVVSGPRWWDVHTKGSMAMSEFLPEDPSQLPADRWARMGLSVAEYKDIRAAKLAREACAPAVGAMAPDFEVERLSNDRGRTGETFRLSEKRGAPVALVFGSYT
ncbi:MAG: hypothetical protein ACI9W2_003381, partial [Gammaproteobacteria bacterium]